MKLSSASSATRGTRTAKWAPRRGVDDEGLADPAPEFREWCHERVTGVGEGQTPEGMDLDDLRDGPLRLLATRERPPAVVLFLDGEVWTSLVLAPVCETDVF